MLEQGKRYEGGCLCGNIRYTITGPSLFEAQFCCRDCQKATGTGHTTIIGMHKSQLAITGTPASHTTIGESGGTVTRNFCGNYVGGIYTSGSLPGEVVMVQAGSLDTPDAVTPQNVIYGRDAVAWDHFDPKLEKFEHYAPMDKKTLRAMNTEGT